MVAATMGSISASLSAWYVLESDMLFEGLAL